MRRASLWITICLTLPLLARQPPALQPDQARLVSTLGGLDGPGFAIAYGERDQLLVAACENRSLHYWQRPEIIGVRSGDRTPYILQGHEAPITALAWTGGSVLASAGADKKIRLWTMPSGTLQATLAGHTGIIRALAMSPDGSLLASAGDDLAIHIWDVASGTLLRKLEGHTDWVMALAFSADGLWLASGGFDQSVRLWERAGVGKLPGTPGYSAAPPTGANHVLALCFTPDGKQIAVGGTDGQLRVHNLSDWAVARACAGHTSSITGIVFHPAATFFASSSKDRTVRIWNPANNQPFKVLEGHQSWVQGLALVSQGTMLASVGADQTVRLWDLKAVGK